MWSMRSALPYLSICAALGLLKPMSRANAASRMRAAGGGGTASCSLLWLARRGALMVFVSPDFEDRCDLPAPAASGLKVSSRRVCKREQC